MTKYLCLRNCFVDSRLWLEGETYDLPDGMEKHEKNFRQVNVPTESDPSEVESAKPDKIPLRMFWCAKCKALHRRASKTGQKHMKYEE